MILGAVVSDRFLRQLVSLDPLPLIDNKLLRIILTLCCEYFKQHQTAPGPHIRDVWAIYRRDADEDEAKLELVDRTIEKVLGEHEAGKIQFNAEYVLSLAEQYLKLRKLKRVADDIRAAVTMKDPTAADSAIVKYAPVRLDGGGGSVPTEQGFFAELFGEDERPLFQFPGPFGQLLNGQLFRTGFLSFTGPAKVGKSWVLMECALKAWWQRCNVAYFIVGDMSLRDVKERIASHMTQLQSRRHVKKSVRVPKAPQNGNPEITAEEREVASYTLSDLGEAEKSWHRRTKGKSLRVDCFPGKSKSIRDLDAVLDGWEHFHKFMADVVVIDYADVLGPSGKREALRDEINDTWIYMRALAQKRNCLLITATQGDAQSYGKRYLDMGNFSDDRRKNDHVTASYGLTQTREDKQKDCIGVNEILVRHGSSVGGSVLVHRCLSIGRFHMASEWGRDGGKSGEQQ